MHSTDQEGAVAFYEALCDSLQDAVVLFDAEGTVLHVNDRFNEVTELSTDDVVGRDYHVLEQFVPADFAAFEGALTAVLRNDVDENRLELPVKTVPMGERVVDARITRVSTESISGATVVLRDVTERIGTTKQLQQTTEQLQVLNAVLRHDIRNDMNIILGWTDQLESFLSSDDTLEITDRISRHGSHILELTYAARDLMHAIDGNAEITCHPMQLDKLLVREVELAREQYPHAIIELPDDLPTVSVRANELLGSVIANLVSNAIRHNDRETPHVEVVVQSAPKTVTVTVADNGPGIPDAQRDAIYETGVKGPSSHGTGLGLYLVHTLVTAYEGTIDVSDNNPRGTCFTITLNRAQ